MSQKIWEVNGLSLELDLDNADNMKRYEDAFEKMTEEEKQLPKDGRFSEFIRAYCQMFRTLYDRIFGEGTAEKIFSGIPDSLGKADEIYASFLDFVHEQIKALSKERAEWMNKYIPKRQQ